MASFSWFDSFWLGRIQKKSCSADARPFAGKDFKVVFLRDFFLHPGRRQAARFFLLCWCSFTIIQLIFCTRELFFLINSYVVQSTQESTQSATQILHQNHGYCPSFENESQLFSHPNNNDNAFKNGNYRIAARLAPPEICDQPPSSFSERIKLISKCAFKDGHLIPSFVSYKYVKKYGGGCKKNMGVKKIAPARPFAGMSFLSAEQDIFCVRP